MLKRAVKSWMAGAAAAAVMAGMLPAGMLGQAEAQSTPSTPTNIPISDTQLKSYAGPWMAVNPANPKEVAAAYVEGSQSLGCYLGLSTDGGATWHSEIAAGAPGQGALVPLPSPNTSCTFASAVYGPDGTLYYAFDGIAPLPPPSDNGFNHGHFSIYLITSSDNGSTFGAPVAVDSSPQASTAQGGDYIPSMATDPSTGRLYVTWEEQHFSPHSIVPARASFSTDKGQTFSAPVALTTDAVGSTGFPNVSVGVDGKAYISFVDFNDANNFKPEDLQVVSSNDGGQSYTSPVTALAGFGCFMPPAGVTCSNELSMLSDGDVSDQVAAGPQAGVVFAAGQSLVGNVFRIQFTISHDGGQTWSGPQTLGVPPGLSADSQLYPNLAVAPNGRIDIVYYDLADPSGLENTYLISSADGGTTFSNPLLLSDAASNTAIHNGPAFFFDNGTFGGGRLLATTNGAVHAAWTDSRRGTVDNAKTDVFAANVVATASVSPTTPFGPESVGSTTGAQTVTITDSGMLPLAVAQLSLGGANAGEFATTADNCTGKTIAPGAACTVGVTFMPTASGPASATLSITDNAADSPQTVALTGSTPAPTAATRLAGTNRITTAVAVSKQAFVATGSAHAVVLARSDQYPDALAGVPLAAAKDGPLLLSETASLDSATQAEIQRVLPAGGTVYLLGGSVALDPSIDTALSGLGYQPVRLAGVTRFSTAVKIAQALGDPAKVFEVTGTNFPDAVSAGPPAIAVHGAILLTNGSVQSQDTFAYLSAHPGDNRTAVGGPAATADAGATGVGGPDRFATSAAVASTFFPSPRAVGMATGLDFPDALSGGALVGTAGGPLLLVQPSAPLPASVASYLSGPAKDLSPASIYVFGGSNAVGNDVAGAAVTAVKGS